MATTTKRNKPRRSSKSDGPRFDVYQAVTAKIVAALEAGTVPWRKPWKAGVGVNVQRNVNSKRPYRGVNQMLLGLSEFDSPWWITYNKMKELGGKVIDGQARSAGGPGPELVVFWANVPCRDCTDKTGKVVKQKCERCKGRRKFFILKWFNVWNVEQIEGLPDGLVPAPADPGDEPEFEPVEVCEAFVKDYVAPAKPCGVIGPKLKVTGDEAAYVPARDTVTMPDGKAFDSPDAFYAACFHELVHSTGHKKRLAREIGSAFGSQLYAREELVAEVGASMLCALAGIATEPLDSNSAAYIANWLTALNNDSKLIVSSSAAAQKAVDLICGETFEDVEPTTNGKGK